MLYAGDSHVGGAADYLLSLLRNVRARVLHVPPTVTLSTAHFRRRFDAIVLSDFPARRAPRAAQQAIAEHVGRGAGLLMVGGWASFSGPTGGWRGSVVERLLPVRCRRGDDRLQLPGGALISLASHHPAVGRVVFRRAPVICGLNRVVPRAGSLVVLRAHRILNTGGAMVRLRVHPVGYPLLVVGAHPHRRVAALATDVAPHWCGGLVDWGPTRVTLPITADGHATVEVGSRYVQLVTGLLRWLTDRTGSERGRVDHVGVSG